MCVCAHANVYPCVCVCVGFICDLAVKQKILPIKCVRSRTQTHIRANSHTPSPTHAHAHTAGGHKQKHTDARSGCTQQVSVGFV